MRNFKELYIIYLKLSILFVFRLMAFTVTFVPPSLPSCLSRNPGEPIIWNVLPILINSRDNTCLDMMFSGHACHLIIFYLSIHTLSTNICEKFMYGFFTFVSVLSVIASHLHYTVDVLIAIFLTFFVYCYNFNVLPQEYYNI